MESQEEEYNNSVDDGSISADDVDEEYIICACGETFAREDALRVHLIENQNNCGSNAANVCEFCSKVFDNLRSLGIHRKRVHLTPKPGDVGYVVPNYLICSECGKGCLNKFVLAAHMRTHTGERPFECELCHKRFTVQLLLTIHRRTHTGERPFLCSLCTKAFASRSALDRHTRVHTGVRPYECAICCKRFSQSNSCKLHYRTVHLKQPCPYKRKPKQNRTRRQHTADNTQNIFEENAVDEDKFEPVEVKNEDSEMIEIDKYEIKSDLNVTTDVENNTTATNRDQSMTDEKTLNIDINLDIGTIKSEPAGSDLSTRHTNTANTIVNSPVLLEGVGERKPRVLQKVMVRNIFQDEDRKQLKRVFVEKTFNRTQRRGFI